MRAGKPFTGCVSADDSDTLNSIEVQTRQMIDWARTGFLPSGATGLEPPAGNASNSQDYSFICKKLKSKYLNINLNINLHLY